VFKLRMAVVAFIAGGFAAFSAAQAQTIDNFGRNVISAPKFYITGGAVIMKRSTPNDTLFASTPSGAPILTSDQFKFGWDAGFDGTIGIRFADSHAIEFRYLGIDSKAANSFVTSGNFQGAGFVGVGGFRFDNENKTDLQNIEINWRYRWSDQLTLLAGFRAINLDDTQQFAVISAAARNVFDYSNTLRGAQIGFDWGLLPKADPFQINLTGKIGLFHQTAEGSIQAFIGGNLIGAFGARANDAVAAGEFGISAGYRIQKNILLRAGYQLLIIDNVALASSNVASGRITPILLASNIYRDSIMYHGANFGVTINW
jgi:hypothetical protein